jgi:hypothetical protein
VGNLESRKNAGLKNIYWRKYVLNRSRSEEYNIKKDIYILTFYGVRKVFSNVSSDFLNIGSTDPSVALVLCQFIYGAMLM